jgi:hypothetical protein
MTRPQRKHVTKLAAMLGLAALALTASAGELAPAVLASPRLASATSIAPARAPLDPSHSTGGAGVAGVAAAKKRPAYPSAARVAAAARYLARRHGTTALAVIDDRGKLSGRHVHLRFHSASTVKSMLLVAYLQMVAHQGRRLGDRDLLYPMIHSSSNEAATAVLEAVGEARLDRVARQAHMRDYVAAGATWGFTEISAADMARFFYTQDSLIPKAFDGYARWLLSTIEPSESWGIPAVARPEFQVFFKGGWLPEVEGLVSQIARLERAGITFAMAVLTRYDPSMDYAERTLEGATAALLGRG